MYPQDPDPSVAQQIQMATRTAALTVAAQMVPKGATLPYLTMTADRLAEYILTGKLPAMPRPPAGGWGE